MKIEEMNLEAVEARMLEIRSLVEKNDETSDFEALNAEFDQLEQRKAALLEEQRKADIIAVVNGEGETIETIPQEGRTMKTLAEVRASKEYIDAFARYIKTGKDAECRSLLSELASEGGQVPVPSIVEEGIRVAWDNDDFLSRVKKTYIKGVLRVGFELSATGAAVHAEGADAPAEEELVLGIITLTPASIKKWITISDETLDLTGEAFLRYVYDELNYQIAKAACDAGIDVIENAPAVSDVNVIGVPVIETELTSTTVAQAISELTDRATEPVIMMNKKTLADFKSIQYSAGYPIDVFENLPIVFNNKIKAYSEADGDDTYLIVGDLRGLQYNFPNGDEITIKYDDLTLAEADLVKLVGREYVAIGITGPKHFVKVAKGGES